VPRSTDIPKGGRVYYDLKIRFSSHSVAVIVVHLEAAGM
jgi:hypothetical protein